MKRGRQSIDARRGKMLSMIRDRQTIKVEELAAYFNVSLMTVRRDLQILEDQGLVGRFYGGATVDPMAASPAERDEVFLWKTRPSMFSPITPPPPGAAFRRGWRSRCWAAWCAARALL